MPVKKWWLMFAQGILLLVPGFFLLVRSEQGLTTSRNIVAVIALFAGAISIIGYFTTSNSEKDKVELIAGICSTLAGIFFLSGGQLAFEMISWLFFIIMLLNASLIVRTCWFYKSEISWWWISILLLIFTLYLVFSPDKHNPSLKINQSALPGIQFLVSGIMLLILAVIIRRLELEYSKTLREIINEKRHH